MVQYADAKGNAACGVRAEGVLIAAGRRPRRRGAVCGGITARTLERGGIPADAAGRTGLPHLYVIGDARAGSIQLAHLAEAQGKNAVAAILGRPLPVDTSLVPACVYTNAGDRLGGHDRGRGQGRRHPGALRQGAVRRQRAVRHRRGGAPVLSSWSAGRTPAACWGRSCAGPAPPDLTGELALAVQRGLTAADLAGLIHPHPTFAEGIRAAAEQIG